MDFEVECPWCGACFTAFVDPRGGAEQALAFPCEACGRTVEARAVEEEPGGFAVYVATPGE